MSGDRMVVVAGVRYRVADAERLGIAPAAPVAPETVAKDDDADKGKSGAAAKGRAPANKGRAPANKSGRTSAKATDDK